MSFTTRKNNNNYRARLRGLYYDLHEDDITFMLGHFNYKCAYCGIELDSEWHIDHIVPVENNDELNINYGTTAYNCVCVCSSCNYSKGVQELDIWLKKTFRDSEEIRLKIIEYQLMSGINEILW